jgi:hypothetical protein
MPLSYFFDILILVPLRAFRSDEGGHVGTYDGPEPPDESETASLIPANNGKGTRQ